MWLISGPFDGPETGETGFQKTKLLRTSTKYVLGRKERHLVVNHKKISHDHAQFMVGQYSSDDVTDSSAIPTLEIVNDKNKAMTLVRGTESYAINPASAQELKDGDIVCLVGRSTQVSVRLRWLRVCCYTSISSDGYHTLLGKCASLGINLVTTLNSNVTHHLTDNFLVNSAAAYSLLSAAQFVRQEWLNEVIHIGEFSATSLENPAASLPETSFDLPLVAMFRPAFPPSLPIRLREIKMWEPNEERLRMFSGLHFVLVEEGQRYVNVELREVIICGGGEYEEFMMDESKLKWQKMLTKEPRKKTAVEGGGYRIIIVGDFEELALGARLEVWHGLMNEAKKHNLSIVSPSAVFYSVVHLDLSFESAKYDQSRIASKTVQRRSPGTVSAPFANDSTGETSVAEGSAVPSESTVNQTLELLDRASSGTTTATAEAHPRKALTRRVKTTQLATIGGTDPPSTNVEVISTRPPQRLAAERHLQAIPTPAPIRPSRLKRRVGTESATSSSKTARVDDRERWVEPPLKKYKRLFEANDPGRLSDDGPEDNPVSDMVKGDQCFRRPPDLDDGIVTVPEHDGASLEKKGDGMVDHPVEGSDDGKWSTCEYDPEPNNQGEAVEVLSPRKRAREVLLRQPDIDETFLKALASARKERGGKQPRDREFDVPYIPGLPSEEGPAEDFYALRSLGDEQNIRGNFMVVVEMDVAKRESPTFCNTSSPLNSKANFKKFQKKFSSRSQSVIELTAKGRDYGIGSDYWRKDNHHLKENLSSNLIPVKRLHSQNKGETVVERTERADPMEQRPALFLDLEGEDEPSGNRSILSQNDVDNAKMQHLSERANDAEITRDSLNNLAEDDSDDGITFGGFQDRRELRGR